MTLTRILTLCTCLLAFPAATWADLVITYDVNILETGPVAIGSTINWEIYATVSGTANIGSNFGIQTASVNLQDSLGETLNPGVVQTGAGQDFAGYPLSNPGTFVGGTLQNIGVFDFGAPGAHTRGETGDLGPFLLATGSYTVTQMGLHTLSAVTSASISRYYSTVGGTATPYDVVVNGSASIQAVPEPASLAMMGLAACGAFGVQIRRRRKSTVAAGE
ncbi:MAG: PEP-CTERM sorting domain-containing protein [Planctomycetaceae bacterium]|nr:PEP-CTERM sorting domain-containing protein [Planctomycetaceae bacterium]